MPWKCFSEESLFRKHPYKRGGLAIVREPGRRGSARLSCRRRFRLPLQKQPAQGRHGERKGIRATHMGYRLRLYAAQVTGVRSAIDSRSRCSRLPHKILAVGRRCGSYLSRLAWRSESRPSGPQGFCRAARTKRCCYRRRWHRSIQIQASRSPLRAAQAPAAYNLFRSPTRR